MAAKGGARPGAGRPKTAVKYESPIVLAEKRIADRLPELVDKAFELASGVVVAKLGGNGKPKVYKVPPDIKSIIYLVDRVMGRPMQRNEISGPNGNAIPVEFEKAAEKVWGDDAV